MFRMSHRSTALAGLLGMGAILIAPVAFADNDAASADAPTASIHASGCLLWDLNGDWTLAYAPQASTGSIGLDLVNANLPPRMKLQQAGTQIRGSIVYPQVLSQTPLATGSVVGTISSDLFEITATWRYAENSNWNFEQTTVYDGRITRDGVVSGTFYAKEQGPGHAVNWHSERVAACKANAASAVESNKPAVALSQVDETNDHDAVLAALRSANGSVALPSVDSPPPPPSADAAKLEALAAVGARIAAGDPVVARARNASTDLSYRQGFDIASGIFGDPALGAQGNTATGPGSMGIRASLNATGQLGFDAAVKFHLARKYR